MSDLSKWLESKYLEWQMDHGRMSLAKWAKFLGVDNTYLNQLLNGRRDGMTMQTAYQIGERLAGHTDVRVTQRYDAQSDADLQRVFARASPVDNARL